MTLLNGQLDLSVQIFFMTAHKLATLHNIIKVGKKRTFPWHWILLPVFTLQLLITHSSVCFYFVFPNIWIGCSLLRQCAFKSVHISVCMYAGITPKLRNRYGHMISIANELAFGFLLQPITDICSSLVTGDNNIQIYMNIFDMVSTECRSRSVFK